MEIILFLNYTSFTNLFFTGTNISTGAEVAIKLECIRTRHPQLNIESKIYRFMQGGGMYFIIVPFLSMLYKFSFLFSVVLKNKIIIILQLEFPKLNGMAPKEITMLW